MNNSKLGTVEVNEDSKERTRDQRKILKKLTEDSKMLGAWIGSLFGGG